MQEKRSKQFIGHLPLDDELERISDVLLPKPICMQRSHRREWTKEFEPFSEVHICYWGPLDSEMVCVTQLSREVVKHLE